MKVTPIFEQTLKELRYGTRRIVHQGGASAGKTVNILGALATMAAEDTGGVTTVTSMSFPHLKGGALRDFETYVYPSFRNVIKSYHRTDHLFTFNSGHQIEFKVFDNEMTARGPRRKRLFVNEANRQDWMVFFQLDSRSDQTIIDYNPSARFWAHEHLLMKPENKLFISDHRHNPFIKPEKHAEIEAYKDTDIELWKVYARGLTGNIKGVIFPNWEMIDEEDFPKNEDWIYSVDFGYTNDPTCIIKQCLIGNTLFVKELCYEPGLPVKNIVQLLKGEKFDFDEDMFYCEHDGDMIRALRNAGVSNATWARKGNGSIKAGIELLKTYNVKYSNLSQNIHRDIGKYIWITDEKLGKLTNVPIDAHNHAFDAIRYGVYTRYLKAA